MSKFSGLFVYVGLVIITQPLSAEVTRPLPNYATPEELRSATAADWELPNFRDSTKPSPGLRLPAEYEPTAAVIMTYAAYPQFIQSLARAVVDAGAVGLLVLCVQEPELTLKRISATALSEIAKHTEELA